MLINLRNRLLFLMFYFSSTILIIAFVAIYVMSFLKITWETNEKLNFKEELNVVADGTVAIGNEKANAIVVNRIFPNLGIYFNLIVDENGKVLVIDSALELPFEVYGKAGYDAWANHKSEVVKFEGRLWKYKKTSAITEFILDDKSPPNYAGETYQIRFLDVTDAEESLITLRNSLLLIGVVLLVIFYFMSSYFAKRALRPMMDAWENQRQFIADASHELKTPLSIINANIGVLYSNKEDTIESQLKWLDYISNGTKRMSGLVNSLLMLSKMEYKNTLSSKSPVNLSDTSNEIISSFQISAESKNIAISKQITADIIFNTYPLLLEQLINILLDNAIRYTPLGGNIKIILNKEKSFVLLKVENSGPGICKEDLPKVFDRFFRADASRTGGGDSYGIGLSIAKSSIDKISGKIDVASIENEKTTFTIKIPL